MAVFKCKMCGGTLEINGNDTVAICEYCETKQTLPKLDDERRVNLFDRANHFRRNNEFDKAAGIYEQILNEDKADAEAYWSLVLCRYGIEYVEDPATHKRIPTVNRAQFVSVFDDENYKSALEYADASQRNIYEEEAKTINEIQKGILSISQKEEPFDVFICYKETDNNGRRTPDSVLANDLYHQLTMEGLKVFFARITLEDKLGTAYEPYIFAALNSAKVMVVLGTKPEYFNAVWVKNEWARYLSLIKNGANKILVPAYKDMDPYDLPEEFSHLQAQDMSKLGFMQDLIRGIKKITQVDEAPATIVKETVVASGNANVDSLLKRVFMFLEDGDWNSADEYCEKVLDIDPENAQAYLGKLMAELRVRKQESLKDQAEPFDGKNNYHKILRFGDETLKNTLISYTESIITRNENTRLSSIYNNAKQKMSSANSEEAYKKVSREFKSISEYKDSASLAEECLVRAENARLDSIYTSARNKMSEANSESEYKEVAKIFETISEYKNSAELAQTCYEEAEIARKDAILEKAKLLKDSQFIPRLEKAITLLNPISGYKDADEMIAFCEEKIVELNAEAEQKRIETEKTKKKIKNILKIAAPVVCVVIVVAILLNNIIIPGGKYKDALALMEEGKYSEAIETFESLDGYKDSVNKIAECETGLLDNKYDNALALMEAEKYEEAISAFKSMNGYKDSVGKIAECEAGFLDNKYDNAVALMKAEKYEEAISAFKSMNGHKDSADKIAECKTGILDNKYDNAVALIESGNIVEAYDALIELDGYKDSNKKANSIFGKYMEEKLKSSNVGDYILFGTYEQDNNTSNGKENIEWLVLEKQKNKVLVISKYALDCKPYNASYSNVTWETCSLRKWLNNNFFNTAFSTEEKAMIPMATVSADKNPKHSTNQGNATKDKVFLLSIAEVDKLFGSDIKRSCTATNYADANGAGNGSNGNCFWWLRTLGYDQTDAVIVDNYSGFYERGYLVDGGIYAVRPALWISF